MTPGDPTVPTVPTITGPLDLHREQSALVVEHLVTHGSATRSELANATGLGRGTIAGLTARLLDAGVIRPSDDSHGDGRSTPLALSGGDRVLVTARLTLDEAVATVASLAGDESARFTEPLPPTPAAAQAQAQAQAQARGARMPTAPGGAAAATTAGPMTSLATVISRAIARVDRAGQRIADLTVLVDGAIVGSPAVVITDPRFGAEPVDVLGELRARVPAMESVEAALPMPMQLVRAAAAAASVELEALPGIGDVLYLDGDTGVSAAAVAAHRPLHGAHGLGATFGHLPIVPGGLRCRCGQQGCLATIAAPDVVLERAGLSTYAETDGRAAALEELTLRIAEAEDRARWSWLDAAHWIGRTLQVVVPTLDPAVVVVGGYWGGHIGDIQSALQANRPTVGGGAISAIPAFSRAVGGPDAAFVGARRQARERLIADPLLLVG
ncbi:Sugar kinase of the NBD/HSP70 family, may contain an N-terminal HTH domain [Agromyces sp. CF514]|uniref:ROK family transcriptional regulator n=1 Tax=Agromyces sp. CF514 TaxID=1881031 RepID=UPI0008E610F2|nr:ROK family transcriptional regulator [Agromyces sp. CF514]SFR68457.1 Sugar kinase of the NBD/HSP70 family, may contain an N-terminal HTH domain [Agromyces sp. CF514]